MQCRCQTYLTISGCKLKHILYYNISTKVFFSQFFYTIVHIYGILNHALVFNSELSLCPLHLHFCAECKVRSTELNIQTKSTLIEIYVLT